MQEDRQRLSGKTALVTGGAVRIGAAICRELAKSGADVVIHYHRSHAAARSLQCEIERGGRRAFLVQGALDTETGCRKIMREALRLAGQVDLLVNNAAVFHKETLTDMSEQSILREFHTNLFAPIFLTREFARSARTGAVINILDRRIVGLDTSCIPYVLTKKGLADATRMLAHALAPRIRVNAVAPGPVLPPPGKGTSYLKDKAGPIPLKTALTPVDIAEAVIFLACARSVTGQVVFVDGGQHLLDNACFE